MTITRTPNGYALNGWEACPGELPTGARVTVRECQAVLCRLAGMTQREAGQEMGCKTTTVGDRWKTLYFKLHMPVGDVVIAINALIDSGVLHRLALACLCVCLFGASITEQDPSQDVGKGRIVRITRTTRRNDTDALPIELLPVLDARHAA